MYFIFRVVIRLRERGNGARIGRVVGYVVRVVRRVGLYKNFGYWEDFGFYFEGYVKLLVSLK